MRELVLNNRQVQIRKNVISNQHTCCGEPRCPTILDRCLGISLRNIYSYVTQRTCLTSRRHISVIRHPDTMSFLGGGAECSTAGNPLSRMKSHMSDDKTLQRDRVGPAGSSAATTFRTTTGPAISQDAVCLPALSFGGMEECD
jgi:hypothetical protein